MATGSQVNVAVNVNTTGLKEANKDAGQLHSSLKGAAEAAQKVRVSSATQAAREAVKAESRQYGVARGTVGTGAEGRDFAKQSQGLGGLVRLYATYAANLFAVSAAFSALSRAADTTNLIKGLDQLGAASGRSLGNLSKQLAAASDGAISLRDAMQATAQASAAGMSSQAILRMGQAASKASQALGVAMPDAISRLSRGITKLEPELLDELGIFVRVDKASEAYARTLGKSTASLTDFEKRQGFANAVLEEAEKKFGNIKIDANPYSKLLASLSNLLQTGLELVNKVLTPILSKLADSPVGLAVAVGLVAKTLLNQALPAIGQWKKGLDDAAEAARETVISTNSARIAHKANVDSIIAEAVALRDLQATKTAQLKVDELNDLANQKRLSKGTLKAIPTTALDVTNPADIANLAKQNALLEKQSALLEKKLTTLKNPAAIARNTEELAAIKATTAAINEKIAAAKEYDKVESASVNKLAVLGKAAADTRRADAAAAASQRINILKETSKGYDTGDISKAWKSLNEGIANARKGLDVAGNAFENNQKKMSAWNAGLTRVSGVGIIAAGAVSSIGSALGALSGYAAAAGIVIAGLDAYFSKNSKQAAEAAAALDRLSDATVNLGSVFDDISRKDPLAQISTQSLSAKGSALTEVADAAETALKKIRAQSETASWWDILIDTAKANIGLGLLKQSSTELSKSVEAAFKLAGNSKAAAEAAKNIKDAIGVDPTDQAALKSALNDTPEKFFELAPKVIEQMKLLGIATAQAASSGTQLDDAFKTASKTADDLLVALTPTDNIAKLGFQTIDVAKAMTKALEDPIMAVTKLSEIAGDTSKLRLLSPEAAVSLSKASPQIKLLASDIAVYTTQIENLRKEEQQLTKEREKLGSIGSTTRRAEEIDARKAQIKIGLETMQPILDNSKKALQPYLDTLKNDVPNLFTKGAKAVADSIGEGFAKAAIIIGKAGAAALGDTIAGTEARNRLEKESLDIQTRQINASLSLANITEQLRFVEEERLIFDKQKKVDELKAKGTLTPAEKASIEKDVADIATRTTALAVAKSFANKGAGIGEVAAAFKSAAPEVVAGAQLALPGAQLREGAKANLSQINAQKVAADIATSIQIRKQEYDIQKDSLRVDLERLNTTKTEIELRAKSALFISDQLQSEKIATAEAIEQTKAKQAQLDFQRQLQDAIDEENRTTNPKARAEAQKAQTEITAKQMKQIAEDTERQRQRQLGYAQEKKANEAAYIKYVLDNQAILTDMQTKAANVGLTIREEQLNLASSLGAYDAEALVAKTTTLNLDKEDQRLAEAKQGLLNGYVLTLKDLNAQLKDQEPGSKEAEAIETRIRLQTEAYTSAIAGEEKLSDAKKGILTVQGLINKELAKQGKLEAELALANALRENQKEIALANLALDEQRLNNAKELNRIDEITYINRKADLETAKQKAEYDNRAILDQQALSKAQDNLRIANLAAEKTGAAGPTAGQVAAEQAVKLAQSNIDKNTVLYTILQQQTAEQKAHNLELAKQKAFMDSITNFTSTLTDLFGEMGTNIGNAAGAMATLAKNTKDRADALAAETDPERQEALRKKQAQAELTDIASVAKANKKLFGEKTAAYKILSGIEKANSIMSMALQAKELAATISNTAKLITETIPGIYATAMKQLGPVFGPVAATAAIAAFVGGAFGGGGSTVDMTGQTASERQASQGTGTVTGDSSAKSQSIANSLNILNATTVQGLSYSNRMVDLLTDIKDGITGVAQTVYGVVGLTTGSAFNTKEGTTGFNILGGLLGSSTTKEITDTGLAIKGTFADIMTGGEEFVRLYEKVLTTTKDSILFISWSSQSLNTEFKTLDEAVRTSISRVFTNAKELFVEAGASLGMTQQSVMDKLSTIDLSADSASLRGLKGAELEEALNSIFSSMLDKAAGVVFTQLKEFNKYGEGMLETAIRVTDGLSKVNLAMQSLNKDSIGSGVAGIRISEALIKASGGLDKFISKTESFASKFLTEDERIISKQAAVNKELTRLGYASNMTKQQFKDLITGFKVVDTYTANVYSDLLDLGDSIYEIGTAAETTAEKTKAAAKALADAKLDQSIRIYELLGNSEEALRLTRQKQLDSLDEALRPGQVYINALEDEKSLKDKLTNAYNTESTAIKSTITSLKASIKTLKDYKTALTAGSLSTLSPTEKYLQSKARFQDLVTAAKAVITSTSSKEEIDARDKAVSELSGASDSFLNSSRELFASSQQYTQDFDLVTGLLETTTVSLTDQETTAQKSLNALEDSVAELMLIKTSTQTAADLISQLLTAQGLTDIARQAYHNSITTTTTGVADTISTAITTSNTQVTGAVSTASTANDAVTNAAATTVANAVTGTTAAVNTSATTISNAIINPTAPDGGRDDIDRDPTGWGSMSIEEKSNYFAANPAMSFLQDYMMNATTIGVLAKALDPMSGRLTSGEFTTPSINAKSDVASSGLGSMSWGDAIALGLADTTGLDAAIAGVDLFADGGLASGWSIVGERGPELVDFKTPGRVYSNRASNGLLNNDDLIAEIRALRQEVTQLRQEQREQTGHLITTNYDANQLAAKQIALATQDASDEQAWRARSAVKIA